MAGRVWDGGSAQVGPRRAIKCARSEAYKGAPALRIPAATLGARAGCLLLAAWVCGGQKVMEAGGGLKPARTYPVKLIISERLGGAASTSCCGEQRAGGVAATLRNIVGLLGRALLGNTQESTAWKHQ